MYGTIRTMSIVILVTLGLCLGSFVNAFVWRLRQQSAVASHRSPAKKKIHNSGLTTQDLSVLKGRSMCPHCKHTLGWHDLLPVVSWLSLGGRCRYCRRPISWQYPIIELLTATLFVVSYISFPHETSGVVGIALFGLWLVLLVGFMALIVYDIRWFLLPDRIVFPLMGIAGVHALLVLSNASHILEASFQHGLSLLFSAGFFLVLYVVSRGAWIGYGDVKLAVVIGLVLGKPELALLMLFIASLLGSFVAIPMLITGKANKSTKLPFGPFLLIGTITVYIFGTAIISWCNNQFLYL